MLCQNRPNFLLALTLSCHFPRLVSIPLQSSPGMTTALQEVTTEHLPMEFRVHAGGQFSMSPRQYYGGRTGYLTFFEATKVEWCVMVENLVHHGYKGSAQLYYLDPQTEGLVLMLGLEQVDDLLHAHSGRKVCDLYIVNAEINDDQSDTEFFFEQGNVSDESGKVERDNDDGLVIDADDGGA